MSGLNGKTCLCLEMPLKEYRSALDLQRNLVLARQTGAMENDVVLILEHPSVFTLGRRTNIENLKASSAFLERKKIPVIPVERGGDITFHGPGQLVVYPIINLTKAGLNVMDYVTSLEEVMLRTASDWGIPAKRNSVNRGNLDCKQETRERWHLSSTKHLFSRLCIKRQPIAETV